jgi:hypothetical protein
MNANMKSIHYLVPWLCDFTCCDNNVSGSLIQTHLYLQCHFILPRFKHHLIFFHPEASQPRKAGYILDTLRRSSSQKSLHGSLASLASRDVMLRRLCIIPIVLLLDMLCSVCVFAMGAATIFQAMQRALDFNKRKRVGKARSCHEEKAQHQ